MTQINETGKKAFEAGAALSRSVALAAAMSGVASAAIWRRSASTASAVSTSAVTWRPSGSTMTNTCTIAGQPLARWWTECRAGGQAEAAQREGPRGYPGWAGRRDGKIYRRGQVNHIGLS